MKRETDPSTYWNDFAKKGLEELGNRVLNPSWSKMDDNGRVRDRCWIPSGECSMTLLLLRSLISTTVTTTAGAAVESTIS